MFVGGKWRFRLTIRNVNSILFNITSSSLKGFRLTIRNVNLSAQKSEAENIIVLD